MIKFITLQEISQYKGNYLCYSLSLDKGVYFPARSIINDRIINKVSLMEYQKVISKLVLISDNNTFTEKEISNFFTIIVVDTVNKEITYINKKYNYILNDSFKERAVKIINNIILEHIKIGKLLIFSPVILKKNIDLSLLSFYFAIKKDFKYSELVDLIKACMFNNLYLCINKDYQILEHIESKDIVDQMLNNKHIANIQLYGEQINFNNNVKNIINTYNNKNDQPNKDIFVEIMWFSNDLLTYDLSSINTKKLIDDKYRMIKTEANSFVDHLAKNNIEFNFINTVKSLFKGNRRLN